MKHRLAGLDLIRLILIIPTIILHVWNMLIGDPHPTAGLTSNYVFYEKYLGNTLGFAGVFIFALSFYLEGIRKSAPFTLDIRSLTKIFFLVAAMISSQTSLSEENATEFYFIWDIFSFVLLSYLLIFPLSKIENPRTLWKFGAIGIVLFLVPFHFYQGILEGILPSSLQSTFIATRSEFGPNGWFLLPWIGLPLFFYVLGRSYNNPNIRRLPVLLLFVGVPLLFYPGNPIVLGKEFYGYVFWQPSLFVFSRILVFASLLLLASQITENKALKLLSYLQWNRNFWICYILHIGVIDIMSENKFYSDPNNLNWAWLYVFLLVEAITQLFMLALKIYAKLFKFLRRVLIAPR